MKAFYWAFLLIFTASSLANTIDTDLQELEKTLGSYPPAIENEAQQKEITKKYELLKKKLDSLLKSDPKNESALYQRGLLQTFGHNMDYPDSWRGADEDLKNVLRLNPSNVRAILDLANLYVNSDPTLAPAAENLYKSAQCFLDPAPDEEAQRGLFFAYYYQGKVPLAYKQALILKNSWPENGYDKLIDMTASVLKRNNEITPNYQADKLVHTSCEKPDSTT